MVPAAEAKQVPVEAARDRPLAGALLLIGSAVFFGAMALFTRMASGGMSASQLVVVRFGVCAIGVIALWAAGRVEIRPTNLRLLAIRGLSGGIAVLLYFVALDRARDTGTAALLNNLSPIFTGVFAWWLLGERASLRLGAGAALATLGMVLVLRTPGGMALGTGEVAGLVSAVFSGIAVTTIRAARASESAATILLAFCLCGIAVALPWAIPSWRAASAATWGLALLVGITSFAAQLMMTHAFGLVPAARGALYQQLTPVFAFALGTTFLGEPLTLMSATGAVLTVVAVAWAALPERGGGAR
jgi:drug/metabolite transporter (DMT)-like permease